MTSDELARRRDELRSRSGQAMAEIATRQGRDNELRGAVRVGHDSADSGDRDALELG